MGNPVNIQEVRQKDSQTNTVENITSLAEAMYINATVWSIADNLCTAVMLLLLLLPLSLKENMLHCHKAYDVIRRIFHELCGCFVDAGNAIWLALMWYLFSSIFMFFFSLALTNAVRTADNRVGPQRNAVDLDRPRHPGTMQPDGGSTESDAGSMEPDAGWRRRQKNYMIPGKTHGTWLQDSDEKELRRDVHQ